MNDALWIGGFAALFALIIWAQSVRPPKTVGVVVRGAARVGPVAFIGFWLLAAIGALIWACFA